MSKNTHQKRVEKQDNKADNNTERKMDEKTQAELQKYVKGIAKILHSEADKSQLKDLEGIEKEVRNLTQKYVMPEIGIFLSKKKREQNQGESAI